jgi:hypothetical protein
MSPVPSKESNVMSQFGIYIISRGCPRNVEKMNKHLSGVHHTWVVSCSESSTYRLAGAASILEVRQGVRLCESCNAALNYAFSRNLVCVQIDDDLCPIKWWSGPGSFKKTPISVKTVILRTNQLMKEANLYLGGGVPVPRINWIHWNKQGHESVNFIKAGFMVIRPMRLRFNEKLTLKEDYEFSGQNIKEFGGVVRCCGCCFILGV